MKKLSVTQRKVLEGLIDQIDFAKKFDNFFDYWLASKVRYCEKRPDYKELVEHYKKMWIVWEVDKDKYHEKWWKKYLEDIGLIHCKTETANKLEALGYIEIIERAQWKGGFETVRLLKRPE